VRFMGRDVLVTACGSPRERYRDGYDLVDWKKKPEKLGPRCVVCGCPVGAVGLCGECACEDDAG